MGLITDNYDNDTDETHEGIYCQECNKLVLRKYGANLKIMWLRCAHCKHVIYPLYHDDCLLFDPNDTSDITEPKSVTFTTEDPDQKTYQAPDAIITPCGDITSGSGILGVEEARSEAGIPVTIDTVKDLIRTSFGMKEGDDPLPPRRSKRKGHTTTIYR